MTAWPPDRFTVTRVRPGYTKAEVDEFVARIEGTLGRALPPDRPVTADEVRKVRFSTTRLRPGYDQAEVDAALDRYQAELAARGA
jgi:DivIVA domain-containing protein